MVYRRAALFLLMFVLAAPVRAQAPNSQQPKERAKAAKALAKQGSAALPALEKLVQDPEYKVRLQAVKSIAKIGTQRSLDPLLVAIKDADTTIQILAVNGLVNFYMPGYYELGLGGSLKRLGTSIEGQFTDVNDAVVAPDLQVRADVIAAIGKIASGGSSMESRANAARAAGVLRGRAAIPDLLKAVRSKNSALIYESLIAMQKIGDKSAAKGITFLLRDLNDQVQIAAIETTGLLQNREALPQLYDALRDARDKKIRRAALTSLAMLPDEKSRVYYAQYINDKDPLTRAAAAEGYGRLKNPADLRMLQTHFDGEKKMNPRLSMAFALVLLGRTDLGQFTPLGYLINTLNNSSYHGVAQPFLVELSREKAVREKLYEVISGATRKEKLGIARILAVSGDNESISHLETLSKDPDPDVSTEGLRAMRILRARLGGS